MALYRDSPETFFEGYNPQSSVNLRVEMYEWMLSVYKDTPWGKLFEFRAQHPDFEKLRDHPHTELVKFCAEITAGAAAAQTKGWEIHAD
ncbi:MAG: hypothetical protein ACXWLC_03115 [Rhizomicrobium sp.]